MSEKDGYTLTEASRAGDLSAARIAQLARAGRIRFVQTPLGRLYNREDVEALAKAKAEKAAAREAV